MPLLSTGAERKKMKRRDPALNFLPGTTIPPPHTHTHTHTPFANFCATGNNQNKFRRELTLSAAWFREWKKTWV